MNIKRIQTIIDKEWAEVFKNRIVLFTIVLLPLLFTAMPLGILYGTRGEAAAGDVTDLPPQFLETCGPIQPAECFQVYLLNQFMLMFMMMPLIIPIAIAAYSIVGEKTPPPAGSRCWPRPPPPRNCSAARPWRRSSRPCCPPGPVS